MADSRLNHPPSWASRPRCYGRRGAGRYSFNDLLRDDPPFALPPERQPHPDAPPGADSTNTPGARIPASAFPWPTVATLTTLFLLALAPWLDHQSTHSVWFGYSTSYIVLL